MTAVFWPRRKSRLSALIDQPGGIRVDVALERAGSNLAALEPQSRALVSARIAELVALAEPSSDTQTLDRLKHVYQVTSEIIAAAGPFNRNDLCTAAKGLCDLIDAAPHDAPFDWRIVTVHAQALQLIVSLPDGADEVRALVLANLRHMVQAKT